MLNQNSENLKPILFDQLLSFQNLSHVVTTRQGGVSKKLYRTLNLSLKVGDELKNVLLNRMKLAEYIGITMDNLYFPDQCHTANIKEVTGSITPDQLINTDALVTNEKLKCIAVLTADCVPVLLYDTKQHAIAAIHAGWRGTIQKIVPKTIRLMAEQYNSKPSEILACMGPSISWENYEIGTDVADEFRKVFGNESKIIRVNTITGKTHLDLWEANYRLMIDSGIRDEHIEISRICTFKNHKSFYSARRDGIACGRFASCIMLQ
jgi:polyphenol oxidase